MNENRRHDTLSGRLNADPVPPNLRLVVACFPKSGSTYFTKILSMLPGMSRAQLVPAYDHREQELDAALIVSKIEALASMRTEMLRAGFPSEHKKLPAGFVAQHHLKYSHTTLRLASEYDLTLVVLVRDIFDVIMSMRDHVRDFGPFQPMGFITPRIALNGDEYLLDFIADLILPWYINFYVGWNYASVPVLTYEALIEDPSSAVQRCIRYSDGTARFTSSEIELAVERAGKGFTRLNQGRKGRGKDLPPKLIDRVYSLASYYPEVDWGTIGLTP